MPKMIGLRKSTKYPLIFRCLWDDRVCSKPLRAFRRIRSVVRLSDRKTGLIVLAVLSVHAVLLAYGAYVHSPTFNEPAHLVAGVSYWQYGRFDIYNVNPPLAKMLAAAPVIAAGCETDWRRFTNDPDVRPEFGLGADFVAANSVRSMWLMTIARWACIPFSLLGAYLCFRWARELYCAGAGLLALILWCFCPNIIAHGQLITSDTAATALSLAACYTFWHWLKQPTWWHVLLSGSVLGVAELAKTTLLIFYPLWPVLWLIYRWPERRGLCWRKWKREIAMLIARVAVALCVVNLGYGFEGTGKRIDKFRFVSAALGAAPNEERAPPGGGNRFAGSWLGALPIPLPCNYLSGIDAQRRDFENYGQQSYLRGEFRSKGWWYYYIYALAIKVPLGTWIMIGLAAIAGRWAKVTVRLRDELILLCPAIVVLGFVSSQTGFNEHLRYVLPIFPFVFVWIGRVAMAFDGRHRLLTAIAIAALGWSIGSSLWIYPHCLSYFNELVGGPTGGPNHLISSNVDWGQDLLFLKRWLDEHPEVRALKLAYYGYFDPRHVGIAYTAPQLPSAEEDNPHTALPIQPGWYAISVNFQRGLPLFCFDGHGSRIRIEKDALAAFRKLKPVAMAGYSIYIYHVEE
jgi:4-amino-4-deoxy-L-arabinose transferase-like glycosyltransferase